MVRHLYQKKRGRRVKIPRILTNSSSHNSQVLERDTTKEITETNKLKKFKNYLENATQKIFGQIFSEENLDYVVKLVYQFICSKDVEEVYLKSFFSESKYNLTGVDPHLKNTIYELNTKHPRLINVSGWEAVPRETIPEKELLRILTSILPEEEIELHKEIKSYKIRRGEEEISSYKKPSFFES